MGKPCFSWYRLPRTFAFLQILLGFFVIIASIASLHRFYSSAGLLDSSKSFFSVKEGYAHFDLRSLSDRFDDVLTRLSNLQDKLQTTVDSINKNKTRALQNVSKLEFKKFLEEEVIQPLYSAHIALSLIRIPRPDPGSGPGSPIEDPLINFFTMEETRKYITSKGNRGGKLNIYKMNKTYNTIGHACVLMRKELDEYMDYDVGSYCKDDWHLAQKLMLGGCDPLPRRRCLTRASRLYQRPLPINESLWKLPDGRNVRWSNYRCRDFKCLEKKNPKKGFNKCSGCFEMEKEKVRFGTHTHSFRLIISSYSYFMAVVMQANYFSSHMPACFASVHDNVSPKYNAILINA